MKVRHLHSQPDPGVKRALGAISHHLLPVALGTMAAGWLATDSSAAEPAGLRYEAPTPAEELKGLEDPTILKRRLWLETEWNKYRDGRNDVEETLGGLWAWGLSAHQDWGVRLKVPYDWHVAGDAVGDSDDQGLGDIKVATGPAFRFGESWRLAGGLELRTPTADEDLGGNDWRLQEFVAAAWDANRWLTLSPSVEYNQSLAELHDVPPQHYLEMYAPATWLLPHHWSVTTQYEAKVDFEADNHVTHSGKFMVAKQFNRPPLGLALSIKRPFDSGEKEFQVNFIITYYFR